MAIFLLIMNKREFHLVHHQMDNCYYDHISFDLKVIRNLVLVSVDGLFIKMMTINSPSDDDE